ncbi:hypothetical protein IWX90DRAFT_418083 [Phyllosticta citrichinensis]|uniref:Uncharacterized protein n=1 Tax=Phyllosticta citrichinensis TaxID=1130410 RepID=A0ABR1XJT7_9PEZI
MASSIPQDDGAASFASSHKTSSSSDGENPHAGPPLKTNQDAASRHLPERGRGMFARNHLSSASQRTCFKPACTHTTMERFYGGTCYTCGRKSPLGFVYVCSQDEGKNGDPWSMLAKLHVETTPDESLGPLDRLKCLGASPSILRQASQGVYTDDQIETLIQQRRRVLDVIEAQNPNLISDVEGKLSAAALSKERTRRRKTVHPRCRVKCCISCRADYRARSYESFEAAFRDESKPLGLVDLTSVQVHNADIVRNIGTSYMPPPPPLVHKSSFSTESSISEPPESTYTWRTTESAMAFQNRDTETAGHFYKVQPTGDCDVESVYQSFDYHMPTIKNIRTGLTQAVKTIFKRRRESSSDGSALSLPIPSVTRPNTRDESRDSWHSLPRSFFRSKNRPEELALSTRRADSATAAQYEMMPKKQSKRVDSDDTLLDGSVEGGIMLTEEAVENHMPDLITQA